MEDVEGRCWDSVIFDGSLGDLPSMLDVALQVASGVAWLHAHGVIHYNLKPANVWISNAGVAKVWKYGEADAKTRVYASPEQLAHQQPLTQATDVWSWAVSVLHMFVGRAVWDRGPAATGVLRRYMQNGPAVKGLPLMPGSLAGLLARSLRRDPEQRTITMDELAEKLGGLRGSAFGEAEQGSPAARSEGQENSAEADEEPAPAGD